MTSEWATGYRSTVPLSTATVASSRLLVLFRRRPAGGRVGAASGARSHPRLHRHPLGRSGPTTCARCAVPAVGARPWQTMRCSGHGRSLKSGPHLRRKQWRWRRDLNPIQLPDQTGRMASSCVNTSRQFTGVNCNCGQIVAMVWPRSRSQITRNRSWRGPPKACHLMRNQQRASGIHLTNGSSRKHYLVEALSRPPRAAAAGARRHPLRSAEQSCN